MLLAAILVLASTAGKPLPPLQTMAGPAFEHLLALTAASCPKSQVRFAPPAVLLDVEDGFISRLGTAQRQRLDGAIPRAADGTPRACLGRDGASCPASRNLQAIEQAGLMGRFSHAVCAKNPRFWK